MNQGVFRFFLPFILFSFFSLGFWQVFAFTHPYPSRYLNFIFFAQFLLVFLSFLYSLKIGRVILIILAFSGTRILNLYFDHSIEIITNAPSFIGGVFGIFIRTLIERKKTNKDYSLSLPKIKSQIFSISILFFFSILGLERFLFYYNFPYIKEINIQELLITPNLYSKQAFGYSVDLLSGLIFPCLFFIFEGFHFPLKRRNHYLLGIIWTLVLQSLVIFAQSFWDISFLADHTNNAPVFQRVTGLFRDAGSAAFVFPCMALVLLQTYLSIQKKKYTIYIILLFITFSILLGFHQGRLYWILLISGLLWIGFQKRKELLKIPFRFKLLLYALSFTCIFIAGSIIKLKTPNLGYSLDAKKIESLDSVRFFLNKTAFYDFLSHPWFGNGVAHLPTSLDNPRHSVPNSDKIIDNPSLFLGILGDTGILGGIVVLIWIFYHIYFYNSMFSMFLIGLSGFIGYHVIHPDSAFWILLSCGHLQRRTRSFNDIPPWTYSIVFFISTLFMIHILSSGKTEKKGPEFRFQVNGIYQDFAFQRGIPADESFQKLGITSYHNFRGSVKWKLKSGLNSIAPRIFLSEATKQKEMTLKLSFLDGQDQLLDTRLISLSKTQIEIPKLSIPKGSYYLRVDELDEVQKIILSGKHIYSIDINCFNEIRELHCTGELHRRQEGQ